MYDGMMVSLVESLMYLNDLPPDLEEHKIAIRNYFFRCLSNHCTSVSMECSFNDVPRCSLDLVVPVMYNKEKCLDPEATPPAFSDPVEETPLNRFSGVQVNECDEV